MQRLIITGLTFSCLVLLASSCSMAGRRADQAGIKLRTSERAIAEESRANTTGIVDALDVADRDPAIQTNAPVQLARRLAKADQQIEGLPLRAFDVPAILAGTFKALNEFEIRLAQQQNLRVQNDNLRAENEGLRDALVEMGRRYEVERNRSVLRRIYASLGLTGMIAALVALCVFVPVLIPILFRLGGWVVGRVPALVGALGVVSSRTYDAVSRGIGEARAKLKEAPDERITKAEALALLDGQLRISTDTSRDGLLIEARRNALNV
jgi:hypothetical protein